MISSPRTWGTLTTDRALRTVVSECDVALADAVAALTATPASAIGEPDDIRLAPGGSAGVVVLDAELVVTETLVS